jgi:DNA repair photolyase
MSTIQASLFELPEVPVPTRHGRTQVRPVQVGSILTKCSGKLADFDYSLNPYRGCGFGCSYCYAAFFVPDDVSRDRWGEWVEVKANAVESLARHRDLEGKLILMSSATDPYQPLEAHTGLTRSILEHLASRKDQPRLIVQTRGPLVTRDIDLLKRLKNVRVNMSVTTDCDEIRKCFEPSCASIERRLNALRELKDAGIQIGACVSPMLPIQDPIQFARTLRELDADRYATVYFHSSDRLFASNTGKKAVDIAREMGWNREKFERTKSILQQLVPKMGAAPNAFAPR